MNERVRDCFNALLVLTMLSGPVVSACQKGQAQEKVYPEGQAYAVGGEAIPVSPLISPEATLFPEPDGVDGDDPPRITPDHTEDGNDPLLRDREGGITYYTSEVRYRVPNQSFISRAPIQIDTDTMQAFINNQNIDIRAGSPLAVTYGRPGGWGSLGLTRTVDQAITLAEQRALQTAQAIGRDVAVVINPNITGGGTNADLAETFVSSLIQETAQKGYYVMLDINTGNREPVMEAKSWIDKYLVAPNVFFDLDLEHVCWNGRCNGGKSGYVYSSELNKITTYYFDQRERKGFHKYGGGIFAFYVWQVDRAVQDPKNLQLVYEGGVVVPILDGFGSFSAKQASVNELIEKFGTSFYGGMEFERRWGTRYDKVSWEQFFRANQGAFMFVGQ